MYSLDRLLNEHMSYNWHSTVARILPTAVATGIYGTRIVSILVTGTGTGTSVFDFYSRAVAVALPVPVLFNTAVQLYVTVDRSTIIQLYYRDSRSSIGAASNYYIVRYVAYQ